MAGEEPTTTASSPQPEETPLAYLQRFWGAHASVFMRWFLALPYAGQVSMLRNASPDIPVEYDPTEPKPKATQLLTPELSLKALLEENGKVFLRLMNARARRSDDCTRHDLIYLSSLRAQGTMPTFSGDTFKTVALAFVDPADTEQRVQSLLPSVSQAVLDEKRALIAQHKLVEADVWLSLQMRQQVILTLLTNVAHTFETMFLQDIVMGKVTTGEIGCRLCGSSTRASTTSDGGEKTTTTLLRCACEAAYYCCKEHQVEDWKSHKVSCKQIRQQKEQAEAQAETV